MTLDDVCRLAQNLARNCGYAVFPCSETKAPAIPGPGGYKHASKDPDQIEHLWREHPGPLIGIATGAASGVSVLDADMAKHPTAVIWWRAHHRRLLPTRTFETRSGGLHCYFLHRHGVTNTQAKLCEGIDTRGEGGYVISWFAAGFGCFDHSTPAPWPDWLLAELMRPPPQSKPSANPRHATDNGSEAILRRVASAAEGERNGVLYWAANRLLECGALKTDEAALISAARAAGLTEIEARRTIASAGRRGP